ncbi:MAG: hypothetical protein GY746_09640 [Gammaproteobacteria bacterium]|nr:hypothetical protein [Gammaproteobacteria bacterium]MCP4090041.1 hypothetical protein [Gammaproteobacteria bacterium]MCP4277959.1 hypothetical protein [Gammaproteobacteria bacterium]
MAVVSTIIEPKPKHTPFTGGSDADRLAQGAARGVTTYFDSTASNWPATGAGDNRALAFNIDLDRDYAYVMSDCSASVFRAGDFVSVDAVAMVEIRIPVPGGYEYIYSQLVSEPSRQEVHYTPIGDMPAREYNSQWPLTAVDQGVMTFQSKDIPNYMLYPFDNSNNTVDVNVVFSEAALNQPAYTVRFAARFLQYDITQAYDWRVQSPTLTR